MDRSADRVLQALAQAGLARAAPATGLCLVLGARLLARLVALAHLDCQLLEQLALARGQARWYAHVDEDVQVAAHAGPAEVRDAPAAQPDLGSGLGSGLDLDGLVTVRRRDADSGPERGLGDAQRQLEVQLGVLAAELRVRLDMDDHVQVARRPTPRRRLALAGQPDLVALVNARRDRHAQRPRPLDPTGAGAGLAGRLDDTA